jgi:hypothetical protein
VTRMRRVGCGTEKNWGSANVFALLWSACFGIPNNTLCVTGGEKKYPHLLQDHIQCMHTTHLNRHGLDAQSVWRKPFRATLFRRTKRIYTYITRQKLHTCTSRRLPPSHGTTQKTRTTHTTGMGGRECTLIFTLMYSSYSVHVRNTQHKQTYLNTRRNTNKSLTKTSQTLENTHLQLLQLTLDTLT